MLSIERCSLISIHALLAESDCLWLSTSILKSRFLSTLSLRRATPKHPKSISCKLNFYPRSPCGERRLTAPQQLLFSAFLSTLSLRRATHIVGTSQVFQNFYPRSPCGERRWIHHARPTANTISIHALLAESDSGGHISKTRSEHFYPRSPCGERPDMAVSYSKGIKISIHALLAESDKKSFRSLDTGQIFLSTLSLRRATYFRVL